MHSIDIHSPVSCYATALGEVNTSTHTVMAKEKKMRTTFGQLEHVADKVAFPSTLNYRERAEMQKKHGCEYGRCVVSPS